MAQPDTAPLYALVATLGKEASSVEPMPGGASTRLYYRVFIGESSSALKNSLACAMVRPA